MYYYVVDQSEKNGRVLISNAYSLESRALAWVEENRFKLNNPKVISLDTKDKVEASRRYRAYIQKAKGTELASRNFTHRVEGEVV